MFRAVPVLPVVLPLGAAVLLLLVWRLQRRRALTAPRAAVALAVSVYIAGVVANTVFPIFLDKPTYDQPWDGGLWLVPLKGYEVADAVMNMVVFVPVGILVPLILVRASVWRVVSAAALFSLVIEAAQYVTAQLLGAGHIADINDLAFDVIGGALGYGLLTALSRLPAASRIIDRFRWR